MLFNGATLMKGRQNSAIKIFDFRRPHALIDWHNNGAGLEATISGEDQFRTVAHVKRNTIPRQQPGSEQVGGQPLGQAVDFVVGPGIPAKDKRRFIGVSRVSIAEKLREIYRPLRANFCQLKTSSRSVRDRFELQD